MNAIFIGDIYLNYIAVGFEYTDTKHKHTKDVCPAIACCVTESETIFRSLIFL